MQWVVMDDGSSALSGRPLVPLCWRTLMMRRSENPGCWLRASLQDTVQECQVWLKRHYCLRVARRRQRRPTSGLMCMLQNIYVHVHVCYRTCMCMFMCTLQNMYVYVHVYVPSQEMSKADSGFKTNVLNPSDFHSASRSQG